MLVQYQITIQQFNM